MKFTKLLAAAALAALTFFTSCQQKEEQLGEASISASPASLEFIAADAPSQAVTLKATRAWRVETKPEWVVLDTEDGKGSNSEQTVNVSVEDNDGFNRSGDLVFSIGIRKAAVHIVQEGSAGELVAEGKGTVDSPFNVVGAIAYVDSLGADVASEEEMYIKGKVSQIEEAYSFSYGNGTFFITDDGSLNTPKFYCYRVYYLGGEKWTIVNPVLAVGDEVVVLSKIYNYKGNTPETVNLGSTKPGGPYNGKLYSLNGSTEPVVTEPDFSNAPSKTVAEFIAAADKNNFYKLHGTVSGFNSQFCSFDLKDESDSSIYVYSVANADEWKTKIANKGTVTLAGAYDYYASKNQHEVVSAWIMSFEPGPEQTEFEDKTVAEFIRLADEEVAYRLTGTVSAFKTGVDKNNNPYMQFDLTDASNATVTVYGFKAGQYEQWNDKISNRGTAKIHGVYKKYEKDGAVTHEVMETVIEDFQAAPEQTVFEDKTIAEFIRLADKEVAYRLSGTVSSLSVNNEKQQMSFNLTDVTGTVKAYGFKSGQFAEWSAKLANGGSAVIHGTYELYEKDGVKTHEVMETVIESFEEAPVVEEQAEGDGTLESPYNVLGVKAFIDSQGFDASKKVYVAGKICQVDYQYNATTNGTFWISSDGSLSAAQFEAYKINYLGNKSWVEGQKSLAVGDEVIIFGTVQLYNNTTYETKSAYLYSLNGATEDDSPLFGVENQTVNVAASATNAIVNVTGNVAWTATSACTLTTGTGSTGTTVSGNGAGAISVAFAANEDTEAGKEYTVTLTTEANVKVKSYTVTIKQGKKSSGTGEAKSLTIDLSKKTYSTATADKVIWNSDAATITLNKGSSSTAANNYLGGDDNKRTSSRVYNKQKLQITPVNGAVITAVTFTATTDSYASDFATKATWTNATAKATSKTVVITPADGESEIVAQLGATSGFTAVKIDYVQ